MIPIVTLCLLFKWYRYYKKNDYRKIKSIIDLENWHGKLKIGILLTVLNQEVLQDIKKIQES